MDWTTVFGLLGGIAIVAYGLVESKSANAFLNTHGLILVLGGTLFATLINTPWSLLRDALKAAVFLFKKPKGLTSGEAVKIVTDLAEKARRLGNLSTENDGQGIGDGFLQTAIDACLTSSDEKAAREILIQRVHQLHLRHQEVSNVFRTMGTLFPMFGLVGTLIGIVTVLKNIANPKNVGPAMAVALSTAFFGILFSSLICVPVANKLRLRSLEEETIRDLLAEGILKIFFTTEIPSQIALYLESYRKSKGEMGTLTAAIPPAAAVRGT